MHRLAFGSLAALLCAISTFGCQEHKDTEPVEQPAKQTKAVSLAMNFASSEFYGAPFPSDARRGDQALRGFPNPMNNDAARRVLALLEGSKDGFALSGGIFFTASDALDDASLPSLSESLAEGATLGLVGIDPSSPDYLTRYPVSARFLSDGGPYGAPNLLVLLPLQGVPLRPNTRYAAFVTTGLRDAQGHALGAMPKLSLDDSSSGLDTLAAATYRSAFLALEKLGLDESHLGGLAAFTTGSPVDTLGTVIQAMRTAPPAPHAAFALSEEFPNFCVFETTVPMPVYQAGTPPYTTEGGAWAFDESGAPVLQRTEDARFVVTIPRSAMPAAGYPVVVMSRTGGGGNTPLVDRGTQGTASGAALVPGTGPAMFFASEGFAGASIDGPHGGLRNVSGGDEEYLIFNFPNPPALRDNIRQSAAELALTADILERTPLDVSSCDGALAPGGVGHFDVHTMALMGHSMGATIAPLTMAFEPRYRAGILSGAGGSLIENILYKQKPAKVKGLAEILAGIAGTGYEFTEHDPLLTLVQWALEPSDPPVYSRRITLEPEDGAPRHVLMMQGIVDHYIMPPIANAESLSLGLHLAGDELDTSSNETRDLAPLGPLQASLGRTPITLPVQGNLVSKDGTRITAVVTQNAGDSILDGHEVVFQTDGPKRQYACFLRGLLSGTPTVPQAGTQASSCD